MTTFISYIRVSTDRQAKSGLGLEAQETAIRRHLETCEGTLLEEYREAESGRKSDRPELRKALDRCKATGATLLIAKLDRLARNVHFIAGLMDSGVDFVALDMPTKNRFILHIYAAMAEEEARLISERTRAGLDERRRRGLPMGRAARVGPMTAAMERAWLKAIETRRNQMRQVAEDFLRLVGDQVKALHAEGLTLQRVADRLNEMGYRTPEGAMWTKVQAMRVLKQLGVDTSRGGMGNLMARRNPEILKAFRVRKELAMMLRNCGATVPEIQQVFRKEGVKNNLGKPFSIDDARWAIKEDGIRPNDRKSRGFVLSEEQRQIIHSRLAEMEGKKT